MTGFGREEAVIGSSQVTAEIKSLNGKQLDINTRITAALRPYELDIRSLVSSRLSRGTVDLTIGIRQDGMTKPMSINVELAASYYKGMQELSALLGLAQEHTLPTLMTLPDVIAVQQEALSEEEWLQIRQVLERAIDNLMRHRQAEGAALQQDLETCITGIESALTDILPYEADRIERVRSRIHTSLDEWIGDASIDKNRLEQELIYYIERIDFSEEKIRLKQHCSYFREILNSAEEAKGKKLGFVLQEVGREINTLGSKANDAMIQKIVVQMKDLLEKAKEQVLNVL